MSQVELATAQIVAARAYTVELLDSISSSDWFRMPRDGVTHVAWQAGHLAMAEFNLILRRVRGDRHEDEFLVTPDFVARFGRNSTPSANPTDYPSAAEIREVFDGVHRQVLIDLPNIDEGDLDAPLATPHRICRTKNELLWWCSRHEMLHAGQIALLRRLFGSPPIW